jgi:alpha-beta hydrolase superfamily lysophospholipase
VLIRVFKGVLGVVAAIALLWVVGPYEPAPLTPNLDTSRIGSNLDAYFAVREGDVPGIRPGTEKRVVWAGAPGAKTDWSVVYVHGFSATSEEIRPVPDRVAKGLGANLIFTRLKGHGRDGPAMAEATVHGWINDLAEALSAARAVGNKVLVISTSTGGTLVAAAAQDAGMMERVLGAAFVSPNFAVNNPAAPLLTWPAAEYWLPLIAGSERSFTPANEGQARFWTTEYPSAAVFPMAALVKAVSQLDHSRATVPALFYFSDADRVVVPAETRRVIARWGGKTRVINPVLGPDDDPMAHVIAGDILSPGQTEAASFEILNWAKGLD